MSASFLATYATKRRRLLAACRSVDKGSIATPQEAEAFYDSLGNPRWAGWYLAWRLPR